MTTQQAAGAPSWGALTVLHTRYQVLQTLRIPIAVIGTLVFPALSFLFFVVPTDVAGRQESATAAALQLSVFAVMGVCLFQFGVGVAEDREKPWEQYLRTLPAGPSPRLLGRLLAGVVMALASLVPLVLLAGVATEAALPVGRVPVVALALVAAAVPLLGIGLTVGYGLVPKAALGVAQALFLPLAFGGGLFLPPEIFPGWLDAISQWLPTRAGRDLVIAAGGGPGASVLDIVVLTGWAVAAMAAAVLAYRRDEGRRFR